MKKLRFFKKFKLNKSDDSAQKNYKSGKLSEIIFLALNPYFQKARKHGIHTLIKKYAKKINFEQFILKKTQNYLSAKKIIKLKYKLGIFAVQYRNNAIWIEPYGYIRNFIKKNIINNSQIINIFNNTLNQLDQKYFKSPNYIINKIDDILCSLQDTGMYAAESNEEKTFYDLALLILLNFYNKNDNIPKWIGPAIKKLESGAFVKHLIDLTLANVSDVLLNLSENLFFNFKDTFKSLFLRLFLNKKTNRGQFSKLLSILNIDLTKLIYNLAENYRSPSIVDGIGEILGNIINYFLYKNIKIFNEPNFSNFCSNKKEFSTSKNNSHPTGNNKRELTDTQPNLAPFQITTTANDKFFYSRNFRFYTENCVESAEIEYCENEKFLNSKKIKPTFKIAYKTWPILNFGITAKYFLKKCKKYTAQITRLAQNKKYFYRIITKNKNEIYISQVYKFEIINQPKKFKFLIFADSQGMRRHDYDVFLKVFNCAVKKTKKSSFAIHMGDFVDDGNNEEYWNWLLDSKLWCETVVFPMVGNHESRICKIGMKHIKENSILNHFNLRNLPKQNFSKGVYYSFVHKNALFIVLNTNDTTSSGGLSNEQYSWALNTAKMSNIKWKIILTHKSPHSHGPHHDNADIREISKQIDNISYETSIDLVVGAHDHVYERTAVLNFEKKLNTKKKNIKRNNINYKTFVNPKGTLFIVPGTSGVKNYKQTKNLNHFVEFMLNVQNPIYSEVEITEDKLFFKALKYDEIIDNAVVVDSFAIEKQNKKNCEIFSLQNVTETIDSMPDIPWISHKKQINEVLTIYKKLDYNEKIKIHNYNKFTKILNSIEKYNDIIHGEISTVSNKKEFLNALINVKIGTIFVNTHEIKLKSICQVNRNLCIRGNAKLSGVVFKVKKACMLLLDDSICINNLRHAFSLKKALNAVELNENSILILNAYSSILTGYGIGRGGNGIEIFGENCKIYLNSKSENYCKKNFIFSHFKNFEVIKFTVASSG